MPMEPNASICEAGRKYYLRNPVLTNKEIALHLTGYYLITEGGGDMRGEGQVPGTFWIEATRGRQRLVAVRTANDEVVVLEPFLGSLGQQMLAIGDFMTAD